MDYVAWSREYWEEAYRVKARMDLIRQEPQPWGQEAVLLRKQRLHILYEMYLDCVHTAKDLGRRAQREGGDASCAPRF